LKGAESKVEKSVSFHAIHFFVLSTHKEPIQYASMNISEGFVLRDLSKGEKFAKRKLEKTWRSVQLKAGAT